MTARTPPPDDAPQPRRSRASADGSTTPAARAKKPSPAAQGTPAKKPAPATSAAAKKAAAPKATPAKAPKKATPTKAAEPTTSPTPKPAPKKAAPARAKTSQTKAAPTAPPVKAPQTKAAPKEKPAPVPAEASVPSAPAEPPVAAVPTPAPSEPAPVRAPTGRVAGLDGLRAIAVIVVVLFHLTPGGLAGGYLGVDVFFVVSGFIITRLLLVERVSTGRIGFGAFWVRRARRLLPALGVLLLACSTAALAVGGDVLVGLGGQLLAALTFSSNWYFIVTGSDYFAAAAPELFRNLWSLAVEEQFYLLWPLLLVLVVLRLPRAGRIALLALATAASALAMALLLVPGDPTPVYYGTGTHAFGLTLGALLAVASQWWPSRALEWARGARRALTVLGALSLAGLLALAVLMPGEADWTYRGGLLAVAMLTAVPIAAFLVPGSPLARAVDNPPLRWVGERSYGIYLWHWPVFVLLAAGLPGWAADAGLAWALGGIAAAITLVAAALSHRYVETPIRRDGFRASWRAWAGGWRRSRLAALASSLALVLAVGGIAGTAVALVLQPATTDVEERITAGEEALKAPAPPRTPVPEPTGAPEVPNALRGDQITAVGDSVMLAAVPELQEAFPGIHIDATVSRQMSSAPEILRALRDAGDLRPVVVLGLGTNGSIGQATLDEVREILGPERELVVITAQAPRGWIPSVNERLAAFAWQYRNVELADWHAAVQPYLHELARDQVHFGHIGATIYTAAVQEALQRLAALPPLRDEIADESLPRPV